MKKKLFVSLFLLPLLASCSVVFNGEYEYKDADKYSEYTAETIIQTEVRELFIDWVNGSVTITKGENFSFSEDSKGKPLYYWYRDNKLDIRFVKNGTKGEELKDFNKELVVTVPYTLDKITIDLTNGNYQIDLDRVNDLNIDVVNGSGDVTLISAKNIDLDVANGSGRYTVYNTSSTEVINFETVNGSVTLNVGEDRDFDLKFKTVNGKLTDNFKHSETENNKYKVNFEAVNGSFTINGIESN